MEETRLMLLVQLIENLKENYKSLEGAYGSSDKEMFDNSKRSILELQNKIKVLVKNLK